MTSILKWSFWMLWLCIFDSHLEDSWSMRRNWLGISPEDVVCTCLHQCVACSFTCRHRETLDTCQLHRCRQTDPAEALLCCCSFALYFGINVTSNVCTSLQIILGCCNLLLVYRRFLQCNNVCMYIYNIYIPLYPHWLSPVQHFAMAVGIRGRSCAGSRGDGQLVHWGLHQQVSWSLWQPGPHSMS